MTFSILAHDRATGAFGVATATGGPAVGSLVPHARAGVGALATQGYTNPLYAFDGLAALEAGQGAEAIVYALTIADPERERRQLIVMDRTGATAGWSGSDLTESVGMQLQTDIAIAGNLLANSDVVPAMAEGFLRAGGPLELRLLAALTAGDVAGGDARGIQSAAIKTYSDQPYPAIDARVDYSLNPLDDLSTLLEKIRVGDYADFVATLPRR
ncbi:MAG: fimbrial assembly protein FimA [Rhizobiales bacterium]|nr:fimbrial assembly protein FimA [Hyphomicrobiales bacterium]|tara:strand:- start:138 stop:776 length:639 start_codon:yes stop_codon:yes gene_type:complete